jgi:hypothetical protein
MLIKNIKSTRDYSGAPQGSAGLELLIVIYHLYCECGKFQDIGFLKVNAVMKFIYIHLCYANLHRTI